MAPLPRHVQVGPHRYRVALDRVGLLESSDRVGATSADRLVIALEPTLPHTAMADTLLHEVVHAVLDTAELEPDLEERVARCLGTGLLDVLRRNPQLVAYLTA